jgi:hypothetical protein
MVFIVAILYVRSASSPGYHYLHKRNPRLLIASYLIMPVPSHYFDSDVATSSIKILLRLFKYFNRAEESNTKESLAVYWPSIGCVIILLAASIASSLSRTATRLTVKPGTKRSSNSGRCRISHVPSF